MMKMLPKLLFKILLGPEKDFDLAMENFALRQQLAILKRSKKRPQIRNWDRLFWILLSRFWSGWRDALIVVKPDSRYSRTCDLSAEGGALRHQPNNLALFPGVNSTNAEKSPPVFSTLQYPVMSTFITSCLSKAFHVFNIFFATQPSSEYNPKT